MIRGGGLAFALASLALPGTALAQGTAPRLAARTLDQLPRPLPAPYDAGRDAGKEVDAALARARKSGKPLRIDFGANWCIDCRVLAEVLDLPRRFGAPVLETVPAILIVDPRTGRARNREDMLGLGDARVMRPQEMADWLARWTQ